MYYKIISYEKPRDIKEFGSLEYLDELLKNKKIIIEEKIDGTLSDSFDEACIKLNDKVFLCLYGENLDIKNFHILQYFFPSKRIVFDCALVRKNEKFYLSPEICAKLTFSIGKIFVPILYHGIYLGLQEIKRLLNENSIFKNEINRNLFRNLSEEEKKMLGNKRANFREGIVIKVYKGRGLSKRFESYKIVNPVFEELLKKYPREKYNQLYLPNVIRPFSYEEFKRYWSENVFNKLGLKISEEEFIGAYENYLQCYNKRSVEECIKSIKNGERYIKDLAENLLEELYGKIRSNLLT